MPNMNLDQQLPKLPADRVTVIVAARQYFRSKLEMKTPVIM